MTSTTDTLGDQADTPMPDTMRGFIISTSTSSSGPTGLIRDMAGKEYLLTPAHWLDEDLPMVGDIVEFEPRVVDKGLLAESIMPITTDSLLTETADDTWMALANEEVKQFRRRQLYFRFSHLICQQRVSPERAVMQIFDITLTDDVEIPETALAGDRDFILNLRPNHSPRSNHPTARRLCKAMSLDFPQLLGLLRGNLSYRAALEQTRRRSNDRVQRKANEPQVQEDDAPAKTSLFQGITAGAKKLLSSD
jgi:hypothetical protein